MIYDYIIVGAGVAGSVCAYELSKHNKKCLILEKNTLPQEKICGGGVSYKALKLLHEMGIDTSSLYDEDISIIKRHKIITNSKIVEHIYKNRHSLGLQRKTLDEFILNQAIINGAELKRGNFVKKINKIDSLYEANGYFARKVVCALGARGFENKYIQGQSIGISSQIIGTSAYDTDCFYFFYYTENDDKYFWIFPIGKNRWNIGIWYRYASPNIKRDFEYCIQTFVNTNFNEYIIAIPPKGEFLGNIDQRNVINNTLNGLGDFAGENNIQNGGGIINAISSAIKYCYNETL